MAIDQRNQVIQARKATIDVEMSNLKSLLKDLKELREKWPLILSECKLVASCANITTEFPSKQKCKRRIIYNESLNEEMAESTADDLSAESEEEFAFKHNVFHVIVASVIAGITTRYDAAKIINDISLLLSLAVFAVIR